jgi:DNA-binding NtrC family response regulator
MESELFGHEKGAFTGADRESLGLVELADGGTLFLDEIGELPLALQAKMLRALQERKIRRVGGKEEITVDVRVVAATNRDLEAMVREKLFREDLYYRVNVARIDVPPLRERGDDLGLLARHLVDRYAREMGKAPVELDGEVLELFARYPWPGNVRQLQNVVKRCVAMMREGRFGPDLVPDEIAIGATERPSAERLAAERTGFFAMRALRLETFEKEYLENLLRSCQGDVSRAAREAQLPRGTLYRLLKKYDLVPESFRG